MEQGRLTSVLIFEPYSFRWNQRKRVQKNSMIEVKCRVLKLGH